MLVETLWIAKGVPVLGLGAWLLLAACNNILDPGTNVTLLNRMMSMTDIRQDGVLGQGLLARASQSSTFAPRLLKLVILAQLLISVTMLGAGGVLICQGLGISPVGPQVALSLTALSITLFMGLWFFFLIGGLWFGYWIKMGQVQVVHFTMLILSVLLQLLVHLPAP